jgi:hypothetical protein
MERNAIGTALSVLDILRRSGERDSSPHDALSILEGDVTWSEDTAQR